MTVTPLASSASQARAPPVSVRVAVFAYGATSRATKTGLLSSLMSAECIFAGIKKAHPSSSEGRAPLGPRYHPVSPLARSAHEVRVHTSAVDIGWHTRRRLHRCSAVDTGSGRGSGVISALPFRTRLTPGGGLSESGQFKAALSPSAPYGLLYRLNPFRARDSAC